MTQSASWFCSGGVVHVKLVQLSTLLLFWVVFVPLGILLRAVGFDRLGLKRKPSVSSYWRVHRKSKSTWSNFFSQR